jgi:Carboxypeptidase regulatory-like domain
MKKLVGTFALVLALSTALFAQTTSISGTVSDPSGAVIPNAAVTVVNLDTGLMRNDKSDAQGRYSILQVPPGNYKLTAQAPGFADFTANNLALAVNQPATIAVVFDKIGSTSTTVAVEAFATQVNTTDASLGNAIGATAIIELPSFARNVANLLQFQPGVTAFGGTDYRNGSVNGGKSDQGNVTLDGVDVNDQNARTAFTSVLRVTPDSVEQFRSVTTNGDASVGRSSGADVALITKSGGNAFHGSLYEYRRGTETAANSFFSNRSGVPIAPLLINIFGGSVGGAIKKNKAFFFINYEGRRDASSQIVTRTVPTETVKQGIIQFHSGGVLSSVNAAQIKNIDPLGIGIDPAALKVLQQYPVGNNTATGDLLNTIGYTFNAPVHSDQNTYIAKFDYKIDEAGRHSLFWRGNLQNDSQNGTPQFPGQQPNSVTLANNKGFATGWTGVLSPTLVNSLKYGFTRVGGETTGILSTPYTSFRGYDTISGTSTGTARIVPVHTINEDLSWSHGAHDMRFGAVVRFVSNQSVTYSHSYNTGITNASVLNGSGADITPTSLGVASGDKTSYQYTMAALLGIVTSGTGNYNYLTDGTVLPVGAPVKRNFVNTEGELYAQDSWKIKRNLTVQYGFRLGLMPPVHEANGQQVSTNIPIGDWFNQRGGLADKGLSDQAPGLISYVLAKNGRPLYPYHTNPAPRLSVAYSPNASDGIAKFLFGGSGKTSIRAGGGFYFDEIGQPLAGTINATAFGLSSTISTPPNVFDSTQLPRFTAFATVPSQLVPPAPSVSFPAVYPNNFSITNSIDDKLKAPYTMNINASIGREFSHNIFVQVAYVGRLSRHSLMQRDLAMPTNLRDPQSGQTYFQAMSQLGSLLDFQSVSVANLPKIPFFENLWTKAAGSGFTATQAVAKDYLERSNPGDFTNVLSDMDNGSNCGANGSTFSAAGKITKLACGNLGPFSMWSPQFSALSAWSSLGSGAYHAMQWTVRKSMSDGLTLDFNYTFAKSIDLASRSEASANFSGDFMINSWDPSQLRGVSGYDVRHAVNTFAVWQVPIGRNAKFGHGMSKILDAFVGGWQLSPTFRVTSGLPFSVSDGSRWATNWELSSFATPNGQPIPTTVSSHSNINLWSTPTAGLAGFSETLAGQTGSRNTLRGNGYFNIDTALAKNFTMPWSEHQKLQFRWEAYNLTNTVRLDPASASLSLTSTSTFGRLSSQLGSPRQMEFAMRYTF